MVLLCRHNSGMLGEDSAAEDIDMADAEQQVLLGPQSIWTPAVSPLISVDPFALHMGRPYLRHMGALRQARWVQRGGNKRKGKGKGGIPKAEANRELERQQAEMEDLTLR